MNEYREIVAKIYIKQYTLMKYFGLWEFPSNTCTSKCFKTLYQIHFWYILIFWLLLFDFVMIMQVITNIDSIKEILKVLFMLATAIAVLGKFLTVKIKNQSFEKFFKLMLNQEYLPQNAKERQIYLKSIELNTKVRNFYAKISYSACGSFFLTNYFSRNENLPVSIYNPIGLDAIWKYNLMYVYVCLNLSVLCLNNVAFDSLSSSFFIHLKGQLDMLGHRLENVGENTNASQDFVSQELKAGVHYYNNILKLSHDIEYLVSIPMSLQIGCSVFVLIANFYVMSKLSDSGELGKLITFTVYQACMLSQIFILCYFANEVSLKSSEISFNLYKSNWYNWDKSNRKLVLLMMLRFDTPIRITSINRCYSFNLAAFTSIVNSSYSYFALLKRTNK